MFFANFFFKKVYYMINIFLIILLIFLLYLFFKKSYLLLYFNNKILELFTPTTPHIYSTNHQPWLNFRNNYIDIKNEYNLFIKNVHYPELFYKQEKTTSESIDINKSWRSIFLRMYNQDTDYAKYFPKTMNLISSIDCITAMFSILEPGTKLLPHRGIDKGVLRYHIAIKVPKNYQDCFLLIKGHDVINKYAWQEGYDILFDDLFEHCVENNTDESRVILLLDIKKEFNNKLLKLLHNSVVNKITKNELFITTIDNINNNLK